MNVVVVESPAKASTINKYLGPDYVVLASYGHVRDLPPKDGSVLPDENFEMTWMVSDGAEKNIRAIGKALSGAQHLYLATDPDREGEAISWHVMDELNERKLLNGIAVERVVFSEITKTAVLAAMANPRRLDDDLVDAYRARRALDYLVGFTLSPILWRKLPGSRSAGRVQSVALRLICQREAAIEEGCAFFDTVAAMGGYGSAGRWRKKRPPLIEGDYAHLTRFGNRVLGARLYRALVAGFAGYLRDLNKP